MSTSLPRFRWSPEISRPQPFEVEAFHGESFVLHAEPKNYGSPLLLTPQTGSTAKLYYQSPDMAETEWYSAEAVIDETAGAVEATWGPELDVGKDTLRFFLAVIAPDGAVVLRVFGSLRLAPSPGFNPATLQPEDIREKLAQEIKADLEATMNTAITAEAEARKSADNALAEKLADEVKTREAGDALIQSALDDEASTREAADALTLEGAKSYADTGDASTLASAKAYTDEHAGGAVYPLEGAFTSLTGGEESAVTACAITTRELDVNAGLRVGGCLSVQSGTFWEGLTTPHVYHPSGGFLSLGGGACVCTLLATQVYLPGAEEGLSAWMDCRDTWLENKQDKLYAGTGIHISTNSCGQSVICATGGGSGCGSCCSCGGTTYCASDGRNASTNCGGVFFGVCNSGWRGGGGAEPFATRGIVVFGNYNAMGGDGVEGSVVRGVIFGYDNKSGNVFYLNDRVVVGAKNLICSSNSVVFGNCNRAGANESSIPTVAVGEDNDVFGGSVAVGYANRNDCLALAMLGISGAWIGVSRKDNTLRLGYAIGGNSSPSDYRTKCSCSYAFSIPKVIAFLKREICGITE